MELKSFRELLLKKTSDDAFLQTVISVMKDDIIADKVVESLKKMARPSKSMGNNANSAIVGFANNITSSDVEMMRDALAHHIGHHKSALKNGNRVAADEHLKKILPLMHLIGKAAQHSKGQLDLDYVPLEPWESNYTTLERLPRTNKLKEGTKGLGRRPSNTDRSTNKRGVPDYRYLEMQPHSGHSDVHENFKHKGGYPFEEIQVGNPAKIDSNSAYLNISDVAPQERFAPHAFDQHPINKFIDTPNKDITQDQLNDFAEDLKQWNLGDTKKQWFDSFKERLKSNPEVAAKHGKTKPSHHFENIGLLDQPDEAKNFGKSPETSAPSASESGKVDYSSLPGPLAEKFSKRPQEAPTKSIQPSPTPQTSSQPKSTESAKVDYSSLPPGLAEKFKNRG